jgi:hypothetical protein
VVAGLESGPTAAVATEANVVRAKAKGMNAIRPALVGVPVLLGLGGHL